MVDNNPKAAATSSTGFTKSKRKRNEPEAAEMYDDGIQDVYDEHGEYEMEKGPSLPKKGKASASISSSTRSRVSSLTGPKISKSRTVASNPNEISPEEVAEGVATGELGRLQIECFDALATIRNSVRYRLLLLFSSSCITNAR